MGAREVILDRIRKNLGSVTDENPPPVPEVWPRTQTPPADLARRFAEELRAVHGEPLLHRDWSSVQEDFQILVDKSGWREALVMDRPLAWQLANSATGLQPTAIPDTPVPRDLEPIPVSILEAECLLADTGSAVVVCRNPGERLACYLPPACVIVATVDRLCEHLPAAWDRITGVARQPESRGECVIITGPSRTADIEKILILGVHGPKRLVVYLIGAE
ncbi:MAG: LUD domain-containing protein [Thermogutta sp.]|uniref:LutC/YkgG family protein n=1 Tax=Thermogutta sp. TaxID=1962930 RepID=UPI0019C952A4|nr:LUD domain-containing protein [Thermogutta sp.]MBC7352667.1 LUD domain-containing protein [Thermogutta sp.]